MATGNIIGITFITLFFILCGLILPYVNPDERVSPDIEKLQRNIEGDVDDLTSVTPWQVFKTVASIFFWSFGAIPFWLDITLFLMLRLALLMFIASEIWIGG